MLNIKDGALIEAVAEALHDAAAARRRLKPWAETDDTDPAKDLYRHLARTALVAINDYTPDDVQE